MMHSKLAKIAEPKPGEVWETDDASLYRLDDGNWCVALCHSWVPGVYSSAVAAWFATSLPWDMLHRIMGDNSSGVISLEDLVVEFMESYEESVPEDRLGGDE